MNSEPEFAEATVLVPRGFEKFLHKDDHILLSPS